MTAPAARPRTSAPAGNDYAGVTLPSEKKAGEAGLVYIDARRSVTQSLHDFFEVVVAYHEMYG